MIYGTYAELQDAAMALYGQQRYAEAFDLLARHGDAFSNDAHQMLYLRSCLAARTGQTERALADLQAALDQGVWYGEQIMRETPSWKPLQGLPEFERLAAISINRARNAPQEPKAFSTSPQGPDDSRAHPMLVVLHGNGDNGMDALRAWLPASDLGWHILAVQSSQAISSHGFVWNDQETARHEIEMAYRDISKAHLVEDGRVVILGFSMGGETALRMALSGAVPARGCILLGPGGPTMEAPQSWLPLIEQAAGRELRCYVLLGEHEDPELQAGARALLPLLNAHGIPCELEMLPGLGHEYPRDTTELLRRALAFVENRS